MKDNYPEDNIFYTIYTIGEEKAYPEYQNCQFVFINTKPLFYKIDRACRYILNKILKNVYISNAFIKNVIKRLKKDKEDYDLVLVENNPLYVLKLKRLYPNKLVLHLHNDYLNKDTKCSREIVESCLKIITISDYLKRQVQTIGVKEAFIETIYNGIDIERFKNEVAEEKNIELRKKYGIDKDEILFLYTGRLIKEKGVLELLLAFEKLLRDYKNIKLLIVGGNNCKNHRKDHFTKKLNKIANKNQGKIIFSGYIEYENIPEIYSMADVQVIPSKWGEPLGNVVIEGAANGIKQIVTNDGGIVEVVNNATASIISKENLVEELYLEMKKVLEKKEYKNRSVNLEMQRFTKKEYVKNIKETLKKQGGTKNDRKT